MSIMSIPCSENTVLINTTHKILAEVQTANPSVVTTMPTPQMENVLGYDTIFESWKLFLCQYKRPYPHKGMFFYYLDRFQTGQLRIWASIANSPSAFFPLVLTSSDQHLVQINPQLLDNVIFVDVMDVGPTSTSIRVSRSSEENLIVEYKILNGPWTPVSRFYFWPNVKRHLEECKFGEVMKSGGKITSSNIRLRETIESLTINVLPSWWRMRVQQAFADRFPNQTDLFLKYVDNLLSTNRQNDRPTRIASRSFRAFVYPIKSG